nr:MAG TPA: hypothetical protein [Caudoviricetes sp.]
MQILTICEKGTGPPCTSPRKREVPQGGDSISESTERRSLSLCHKGGDTYGFNSP